MSEANDIVVRLRARTTADKFVNDEPGVLSMTYKDDPLTTEVADLIHALQQRVEELEAALAVVNLCDATGGEHQVERQGNYRFCKACGETMTEKRIRDAKRASASRAALTPPEQ